MELITKEAFRQLAEVVDTPCVSIYMPVERDGDKQDENRIRLKNYLTEAENALQERSHLAKEEVADLLEPAARLIEGGRFIAELEDGLAIFLSTEQSHIYSLPIRFEETGILGSHFYLKPLLPLLTENGRFYILALSQNEIRLLQASRYAVHEVILPDEMPQTISEALKWEDPEPQLQWHTGTSANAGQNRRAIFHGHGGAAEGANKKVGIEEYFRQVAGGIDELLKEQSAPLVLAGVDYLLPLYRQATNYPHVVAEDVRGNPEQFSAEELRDQVWELVAPLFAQQIDEAMGRLADHTQTDFFTQDLETIIAVAHYGQIDLLFLDEDLQIWGMFDSTSGKVHKHEPDDNELESEELLDRTAVHTYLFGGTIYLLPRAQIPGELPAAALLRVPVTAFA